MMSFDLRTVVENFVLVIAALIPIVNPMGAAPVFVTMTRSLTPDSRTLLARRVALNAFLLLAASMFIGNYVLGFFGLSVAIVQVGGGLIVCSVAWALLKQEPDAVPDPQYIVKPNDGLAKAFYPLTLPLTVGPGSISVAITLGANHANNVHSLLNAAPSLILGSAVVALSIYLCFRYSYQLTSALGTTGTLVFLRLFAFILLCIGVQIIWNGLSALLSTFHGGL
ncbi:MAG: NAAT family transporter [Burkholderiales bacterium]|jgi:multiple antibiotic resistance protein|nr:NAAT family transporter [Burkholderiales bacterium]